MHEWTEQAQKAAFDKVMSLAANDAAFRKLALDDARAAVEQATGQALPDGFVVRFFDPAGAHLNLVLPPATYEEELDEAELAGMAGGALGGGASPGGSLLIPSGAPISFPGFPTSPAPSPSFSPAPAPAPAPAPSGGK